MTTTNVSSNTASIKEAVKGFLHVTIATDIPFDPFHPSLVNHGFHYEMKVKKVDHDFPGMVPADCTISIFTSPETRELARKSAGVRTFGGDCIDSSDFGSLIVDCEVIVFYVMNYKGKKIGEKTGLFSKKTSYTNGDLQQVEWFMIELIRIRKQY